MRFQDPEKNEWEPVTPRPRDAPDVETPTTPPTSPTENKGQRPSVRERGSDQTTTEAIDQATILVNAEDRLQVTEDDLLEARAFAAQYTLEEVKLLMQKVYKVHRHDPNLPLSVVRRIEEFIGNASVFEHPEKHQALIQEMKLEAALITTSSPYSEVRAIVESEDDPNTPCSTIRAWVIGLLFSFALAFVNQLFSIRLPPLLVLTNVAQFLAYFVGKAFEIILPDVGFTVFGVRHSLNPGRFSQKEHMLITMMANVSFSPPYTNNLIWIQYLPFYFNQSFAGTFGYQILVGLSTNFIGYGLSGLVRRFLVYPSYCIWPTSLVTIALNTSLRRGSNKTVEGPGNMRFRASRRFFFFSSFSAMAVYFFLPNYFWTALSNFSWMSWIDPTNRDLATITGFNTGLGLNPWPTFDWNVLLWDNGVDPLIIPFFSTFNKFVGAFCSMFVVLGLWYTNSYNTGYLPINSNRFYDNQGAQYRGSFVVGEDRMLDQEGYETYSPPFISAGNIVIFMSYFALYTALLTWATLYHRREITSGIKSLWASIRGKGDVETVQVPDVHNRLMEAYKEVPEWWYIVILVIATGLGIAGVAAYETDTTPGVVFYGLALALIFVVPVGLLRAMTGIDVTLNVLAEFIGGAMVEGNATSMNYFKTFGYVTCAQAIKFSNNLKLGHYVKVPPRQSFAAQLVATLLSTLVCTGVQVYQMHKIPDVCNDDAPMDLLCWTIDSIYTSSIFWGTIGPKRIWGPNGIYTETLIGFPLGAAGVLVIYLISTKLSKWAWLRQVHPVALIYGGILWAPYNMSYMWPAVPISWLSWIYFKKRFLGLWSKYNFTLSAAFSTAIAISGILMYFTLEWFSVKVNWWGTEVNSKGCEASPCVLYTFDDMTDYFGPRIGEFH
ncbi:hypothetical protein jhhlp_000457 [Lomentospora prolificans]|uniref:OPT family small oligopeptide transporter n=1 Tax=Lomentospora prolificans TaxID=41688 RepID=A0A2N3NKY7_9PEZI|nr:hypothetical protein jhhlp_000457 [Lomentospora prolificans]